MTQFCCKLTQAINWARWWNSQLLGSGVKFTWC